MDHPAAPKFHRSKGREMLRFILWSPTGLGVLVAMLVLVALSPGPVKIIPVFAGIVVLLRLAKRRGIGI